MRIAMVSEHASPLAVLGGADAGGQNVHVASLALALAQLGHEVEVYTRRDEQHLADSVALGPGVEVVHVPAGPPRPIPKDELHGYMPAFGDWLAARWADRRPDVVHAHFWMSGLACVQARRSVDFPFVQTFHALGVVKRRHQGAGDTSPAVRQPAEQRLASVADAVIATATEEVHELLGQGARPESLQVVPCGVQLFEGTTSAGDWWHGAGGRVLSLGRLVERKGVDTVVVAMAALADAELVIAGGPARDFGADPEVRRLRRLVELLGLTERVHLVGAVTREQVPGLLRSADVVACTPWYEPFGIVPLEAMACGRPVVGSAVGGLLDTVLDGVTGIHVPPRDAGRLAAALGGLLADPGRRRELGAAGAARVVEKYSWPSVAAETEAVYQRIAAAKAVVGGRVY
jgi:glycosyltransferase involved in cell wall biosynthesis